MKSHRGFALFSLVLLLPVVAGLLSFALRLTDKLNTRDRARRVCLTESLKLQRSLSPLARRPDVFWQEGRKRATELLIKIRSVDPETELQQAPSGVSPRIFTGAGAAPAGAVVYRLGNSRLCGAYAERKDRTWKYRIVYHTAPATAAGRY